MTDLEKQNAPRPPRDDGIEFKQELSRLASLYKNLTLKELRICVLIGQEYKNWEIAEMINTNEHNIENHRYTIRKKLGLKKGEFLSTVLLAEKNEKK